VEDLCAQIDGPALICGEIQATDADRIRQQLGAEVSIASPAASLRRAAYLAELGWERLARGESDDAATLSPIYLHDSRIHA
jgi:tRNA threonylcarbamoyladenosine biosynthesis protein TsaB